jgi:hypothetical protein
VKTSRPYIEVVYPYCVGAATIHGARFAPGANVTIVRTGDPEETWVGMADYSGDLRVPVEILTPGSTTFVASVGGVKVGQARVKAYDCGT